MTPTAQMKGEKRGTSSDVSIINLGRDALWKIQAYSAHSAGYIIPLNSRIKITAGRVRGCVRVTVGLGWLAPRTAPSWLLQPLYYRLSTHPTGPTTMAFSLYVSGRSPIRHSAKPLRPLPSSRPVPRRFPAISAVKLHDFHELARVLSATFPLARRNDERTKIASVEPKEISPQLRTKRERETRNSRNNDESRILRRLRETIARNCYEKMIMQVSWWNDEYVSKSMEELSATLVSRRDAR